MEEKKKRGNISFRRTPGYPNIESRSLNLREKGDGGGEALKYDSWGEEESGGGRGKFYANR